MAKSSRAYQAREAARTAGSNPYMRRLIEDEEIRNSIKHAFDAARDAYQRMSNSKGPAHALIDDKKVHRDLRQAAESIRDASERIRGKRRSRVWPKVVLVGLVGAGLALVLSEDLRRSVLDKLFGPEEEFEYTSTTSPPVETPAS
jgi:hypothetical protein